jgi:hypothetical protein
VIDGKTGNEVSHRELPGVEDATSQNYDYETKAFSGTSSRDYKHALKLAAEHRQTFLRNTPDMFLAPNEGVYALTWNQTTNVREHGTSRREPSENIQEGAKILGEGRVKLYATNLERIEAMINDWRPDFEINKWIPIDQIIQDTETNR